MSRASILLVDDQTANRVALEAVLSPLGLHLVHADSGAAALKQLLLLDFTVILMDVRMPGLDGYETAALIRQRQRSVHTPIIFLTAEAKDSSDVLRAYDLGAVGFLAKPFEAKILLAKVAVLVALHVQGEQLKLQAESLQRQEQAAVQHEAAQKAAEWRRDQETARATRLEEARSAAENHAAALAAVSAELRRSNEELATADRRKDEFLAMLAHELRNPMSPIVTGIQLLKMPGVPEPVVQRTLVTLERQTGHLVRLVDDLLDLSRITTGKIELRRESVTLSSVVSQAIQTSTALFKERDQRFDATLPEQEIPLDADGTRLSQVVANLLNNAAKYSPPRATIALVAERQEDEVVIRVRDQGIGIRPEMLEAVFVLFVQLDQGPERAHGGLGLGLALVKKLVEMHGGSVRAHSAGPGQGSEFCVRLPIARKDRVADPPPDAPVVRVDAQARRVMIVEDNDDVRATMKDLLESWGHETHTAADGPGGVEAVLSHRPDIALIDIGLPGLDGYGVAAALRARAPDLTTRLVALTGYGRPEDRRHALDSGFDDHLVKPVGVDALRQMIASSGSPPLRPGPSPEAS